jgi:hypothetical protein
MGPENRARNQRRPAFHDVGYDASARGADRPFSRKVTFWGSVHADMPLKADAVLSRNFFHK